MIRPWKRIHPQIGPGSFVASTAALIGDVKIGLRSSIWFGAVLRGDDAAITVGDETSIQENCVIHVLERDGVRHPTAIGSRVTIGHSVTLHGCTIGDLSIVGMGS